MAAPSYTYTLANGSIATASYVMQNFNDILNGVTDGTKDLNCSTLALSGNTLTYAAGPTITATATDIALVGNVRIGTAAGPQFSVTGTSLVLSSGFKFRPASTTASTVPYIDANKDLVSSATTPTQLGYLAAATGTTGTTSTNLVFSASPTFTGTVTAATLACTAFSVDASSAGSTVTGFVRNSDNTNGASHAMLQAVTGGASGGDAIVQFYNGVTYWSTGLDNSASDAYVISQASSLGSTNFLTIATSGNVSIGNAALATNATDGFFYGESCAGVPTGAATAITGRIPTVYDSTNDTLYSYNSSWKKAGGKTVVYGTAQTSDSTVTSTTYADFTNQPTVSITPVRSGKYRVYCKCSAYKGMAGPTIFLKINNSVGSATLDRAAGAAINTVTASAATTALVEAYYTLSAGTAYTFTLQGKIAGGDTITINNADPEGGTTMIVEEID